MMLRNYAVGPKSKSKLQKHFLFNVKSNSDHIKKVSSQHIKTKYVHKKKENERNSKDHTRQEMQTASNDHQPSTSL